MEPHLEMAYNKSYPKKVFFFCHEAPKLNEGGETPIVEMKDFHLSLPIQMVEKLRKVGIKYMRHLPSAASTSSNSSSSQQIYTWQSIFFTDDKLQVEKRCLELGYDFSWDLKDNSLSWSYVLPAFIKHTPDGEECWFNQATCLHGSYYNDYPDVEEVVGDESSKPAPTNTCYGDGTPFSLEEVQFMRARLWERACAVSWSKGDLLVMDNTRVAHGRMSFSDDSKRAILVSLSGDD